jgi:CheY-like chemotaxis protein
MLKNSILLIDDDELFREAIQMMLEDFGFDVVVARNGSEGVSLFDGNDVKMVVTDILMPEKDGLEVIQELRQKNNSIPILAISGGSRNLSPGFNNDLATAFGATATLRKPFLKKDLYQIVQPIMNATN